MTDVSWKYLPKLCFCTYISDFAILSSPSWTISLKTEGPTALLSSTFNKEAILSYHYKELLKGMSLQPMPSLRKGSLQRFKLHLISAWVQMTLGLILFLLSAWVNKFHTFGRNALACFHRTRQAMIFEFKTSLHIPVALRVFVPPKLTQKWKEKT